MSTGLIVGIVVVVIIVVLIGWGVSAYNNLVTLKNRVKNGWAQIDVQLKQRADLIPNLVNTVKGYASHESASPVPIGAPQCCPWTGSERYGFRCHRLQEMFRRTASCRRADQGKRRRHFALVSRGHRSDRIPPRESPRRAHGTL